MNDRAAAISLLGPVLRRVIVTEGDDPCWLWPGAVTSSGYPVMSRGNRQVSLHRLILAAYAEPLAGRDVHHLCQQRRCIRPAHLVALTRSEHMTEHVRLRTECAECA